VAGGGQFPALFCRAARERGLRVHAVFHEGDTDPALGELVDDRVWIKLGQFLRMADFFKRRGVEEAVMAGGISKRTMFRHFQPDARVLYMLFRLGDRGRGDDRLLRAMADEFEAEGIAIRPSTLFTPQLVAPPGLLSGRPPTGAEEADMDFGWKIAKALGQWDVGQCVVVRDGVVLALEAVEGTDETIRRGGGLAEDRAVVVKTSKPGQDLRFDMPTVGRQTIEVMAQVKASALLIEAGRTLIFDREDFRAAADEAGIAVLCREP